MKIWRLLPVGLVVLAVASALTMGPIRLSNNKSYVNFTLGASPENSVLECVYHLEGAEHVDRVTWELWKDREVAGSFDWYASQPGQASGSLVDVVNMERDDASLEFTELKYDLAGEYLCRVTTSEGDTSETSKWEVLFVDSISQHSVLHRSLSECKYTSNYSTMAMFPEPVVRAGLYSDEMGSFYKEIPSTQWLVRSYENGSVSHSYSGISFKLNEDMPVDISFYVMVGVMKADGNYIPISSALDEHIILHHLGCEEPRLETYQFIVYHRDTITCRGEHRETEALVTCKEGYHADGEVEEVLITCNEPTRTWVLEDGTAAKREDLRCVMDAASSISISGTLIVVALVLQRFLQL